VTGSHETRLIVVRGPSGAGKSTVARALRERMGRGTALVEQDYVRRVLLWEKDLPGAVNIGLIDTVVRHALDAGYDVVLEGILTASRYGDMLRALAGDHAGITVLGFLDVTFEEAARRHSTRPQSTQFTTVDMAAWWVPDDRLAIEEEIVIGHGSSAAQTVEKLLSAAQHP
jgi:predicted kinase